MLNIHHAKFYADKILQEEKSISIHHGKIAFIEKKEVNAVPELVVPGFIDLQIYGSGGRLFSAEPTVESLMIMEDDLLKKGTTGFLACLATNTPEVFNTCIAAAKEYRSSARNLLGLHLEGPFLNPKRLGAHVPAFVKKATLEELKALLDFGDGVIKMITIAPEIHGDEVIQYLLDHDVVVSLGHSDATFEEATHAYNYGIQTTTHLFNAMTPIHHRAPGIPTAFFHHDKAMASIIVDGEHVDFSAVKLAYKLAGDRLFLITDAVTPCSTGPYQHIKKGNKFVMPDGTLSGSSLTMLEAVKNCVKYCDIELSQAVKMATEQPAKLLGTAKLTGKIAVGQPADLLVLDEDLNLKKVIFKGKNVPI